MGVQNTVNEKITGLEKLMYEKFNAMEKTIEKSTENIDAKHEENQKKILELDARLDTQEKLTAGWSNKFAGFALACSLASGIITFLAGKWF